MTIAAAYQQEIFAAMKIGTKKLGNIDLAVVCCLWTAVINTPSFYLNHFSAYAI